MAKRNTKIFKPRHKRWMEVRPSEDGKTWFWKELVSNGNITCSNIGFNSKRIAKAAAVARNKLMINPIPIYTYTIPIGYWEIPI